MFPSMRAYKICNGCNSHMEIWYNCRVCNDFDLCMNCYDNEAHPHTMNIEMKNNSSASDQERAGTQQLSISKRHQYHKALQHCIQCDGCALITCDFMKRVLQHVRPCGVGYSCPVYSLYVSVCLFHAHFCTTTQCQVFMCSSMKEFIREDQLQQALRLRTMARINETYNLDN